MSDDHEDEIDRLTAALAQSRAETQAALAGCVKVSAIMWCDACRAVGAMHCAHPDECGNMISAQAHADSWKSWIDDLPLDAEFQPGLDRLQDFIDRILAAIQPDTTLQQRANEWALACFGAEIVADKTERTHRFLEEALELTQACGCTKSEVAQLVDYVFARDRGDVAAEVGDVLNTIAMLCTAHGIDMDAAGHKGLDWCWAAIDKTRAKRASKPIFSPLPDTEKLVREARK